jgi:hypothetical protein
VSRTALGPTQTSTQGVPGVLSLWVKRPGREADHSLPSSAEVKKFVELLYFHSPNTLSRRAAQLKRSTGITSLLIHLSILLTELLYLILIVIFKVPVRTRAISTLFGNVICNVFSKYRQPTSSRYLCCVYYRIECKPVVKIRSDCSRCQGVSNVHFWRFWFSFSLFSDIIVTGPCQTEISYFGLFIGFRSLAHSFLIENMSTFCHCCVQLRKSGLN